eukprot:TRINITY_DN12400_c0_g1_i1.p1 TRINITY_DN12400_c0_g1~~TRINITY_DN12400_c0_g1_i1.p1  ORF type:complete len:490 (-),score=101.35 TRINITY_DN12400_c0_g1_i1:264-1733(-)
MSLVYSLIGASKLAKKVSSQTISHSCILSSFSARRTTSITTNFLRSCKSPNRHFTSTSTGTSSLNEVLFGLHPVYRDWGPHFAAENNQISFLLTPEKYLSYIKQGISKSKNRIVISTLYLGTGKQEKELVDLLLEAKSKNPGLKITILLDYLRGTRLEDSQKNSVQLLLPLLTTKDETTPSDVSILFYHTPLLGGLLKKVIPPRVNELFGVQHTKIFVFDNDVMITGANMSETYFTTSQDRYLTVRGHPKLADFFDRLVETLGRLSFALNSSGELKLKDFADCPNPTLFRESFEEFAMETLQDFFFKYDESNTSPSELAPGSTLLFPTVQMGSCNITYDEDVITELMTIVSQHPEAHIYLSSPYLNLTGDYKKIILNSKAKVDVVTASMKTNRFHNAKGFSALVPSMYAAAALQLESEISKMTERLVSIWEYDRKDWTFHGKGMWCVLPEDATASARDSPSNLPSICVIGSGNFGEFTYLLTGWRAANN